MPVDQRASARLRGVTLLGATAAHFAFALAGLTDSRLTWENLLAWLPGVVCLLIGFWWMGRLARSWPEPPAVTPLFVLLAVGSLAWDFVTRRMGGSGQTLEVVIIGSMRNVMLGMAATAVWRSYQPLTMLLALFVSLFSLTMHAAAASQVATGVYAITGIAWLSLTYWTGLEQRLIRRQQALRPTWIVPGVAIGLVIIVLSLTGTRNRSLAALEGWLRSSGGSGDTDSAARSGVGDGETLVKGEDNIQSFGPIEDAPMVESHQPSLYDVQSELYGEPPRKLNHDRAISLPPHFSTEVKQRMSKTERATQEFTTNRRGPSQSRRAKNLSSHAIFYVKGRTPLHLRLETYDLFDGETWYAEAESELSDPLIVDDSTGRPWIKPLHGPIPYEFYAKPETHAIKVVWLETNRIPMPPHLLGVHIDLVDRTDMFHWTMTGQLAMARKSLPSLTAIHLKSRTLDERRIDAEWKPLPPEERYLVLPDSDLTLRLRELADLWTAGAPTPWQKIDRVRNRLKQDYQLTTSLKPNAHSPDESTSALNEELPFERFLFTTRLGPDYQFATAATLLLRTQGIPARVVSGFYARPDRFDMVRKHTPVLKDDVHFWTEVKLSGRDWTPIEVCPGYEVLGPPPGWWDRILQVASAALIWSRDHWPKLLLVTIVAAISWRERVRLCNLGLTLRWRLFPARTLRGRVLETWQLLDQRLQLFGLSRPPGISPQGWLRSLGSSPQTDSAVWELAHCGEWAAFCPESVSCPAHEHTDHHVICVAAVRELSHSRLLRLRANCSPLSSDQIIPRSQGGLSCG